MKERSIYEIRVNIKSSDSDHAIIFAEGRKYSTPELAHQRLEEIQKEGEKSPYLTTNHIFTKILHQVFEYPDKTQEIWHMIRTETLVEE